MDSPQPDLQQLKEKMRATWMAGDFGKIAAFNTATAADFVGHLNIKPGEKVLDVACGTGNLSFPAARAGAIVTGVDIAPNLLEQARAGASAEGLKITFDEGDAEKLPYPDATFHHVITMFGAMFAPRPDVVAAELLRVCKPGGTIAMANWTPGSFIGKTFALNARYVPPPPNVLPPLLWGDEATARQRLQNGTSTITFHHTKFNFQMPFPPEKVVAHFREFFGPTRVAFSRLEADKQADLARDMEELWRSHNEASGENTSVSAEYLEVIAVRA